MQAKDKELAQGKQQLREKVNYRIAGIFGGGLNLANWQFCFDSAKIKPAKYFRDL